jgi:hypothetical protein
VSKSDTEYMLRACALQYGRSWNKSLPYAEFSYNKSYQESLKMSSFEMLYGHGCRTPLKLRSKFVWLGRTYELCNHGRRAMPIIGEES